MIRVKCAHCGRVFAVEEESAGETLKCCYCGTVMSVPELTQLVAEAAVNGGPRRQSEPAARTPRTGFWTGFRVFGLLLVFGGAATITAGFVPGVVGFDTTECFILGSISLGLGLLYLAGGGRQVFGLAVVVGGAGTIAGGLCLWIARGPAVFPAFWAILGSVFLGLAVVTVAGACLRGRSRLS